MAIKNVIEKTGYQFAVTCPRCGGPVAHEASSMPHDSGMRVSAVVHCENQQCRRRWQIVTELITCGAPPPLPAPIKENA